MHINDQTFAGWVQRRKRQAVPTPAAGGFFTLLVATVNGRPDRVARGRAGRGRFWSEDFSPHGHRAAKVCVSAARSFPTSLELRTEVRAP
jgi:hypothetical protein